jgi:hypothetical protein
MNDKNLEQRTNIKFCVKIGNGSGEMLAMLTLAYGI